MNASGKNGSYPRPQLCRPQWTCLDGVWRFAADQNDLGLIEAWFAPGSAERFTRDIVVPFPPESMASTVHDGGPHPVVWYRREVSAEQLRSGQPPVFGSRVLIQFGAVDYCADVWFDGRHVGRHIGGQSPFAVDVTDLVRDGESAHVLVVRAQDDPTDLGQPRGKQTWQPKPSKVWYERTTGIWQSVWSEVVPATYVHDLWWQTDPASGVQVEIELSGPIKPGLHVTVELTVDGRTIGSATALSSGRRTRILVPIAELTNGVDREDLLWFPEHPVLVDAGVMLREGVAGPPVDEVTSYLGIRTVGVDGGRFLLNGRPYEFRAVLNQGYREHTLLANTGTEQLRAEVELAKAMGFNAMRIHQKAEDPRVLYWADRLGLLVWAEIGAAYEFSTTAMQQLTAEWLDLVRRDRSHPSVVAWVPINESWGLSDLPSVAAQRSFAAGLAQLTRALDPSRPAMSNEGWEHVDSDILGVHDYTSDPLALAERVSDSARVAGCIAVPSDLAAGRVVALTALQVQRFKDGTAPLMVTEFGGLSLRSADDDFAYHHVDSVTQLAALMSALFDVLRSSPVVAGFCYTQLFDTAQEQNGLADRAGQPKLPLDTLRRIVTGTKDLEP